MRTYCPFLLLALYPAPFCPENEWPECLSDSPGVPTFYFPQPSFLYLFCMLSLEPYRQVKEKGAWEEESISYLFLLMFWWQETKTHCQRKYWAVSSWHTKVASPQPFSLGQPVSPGSSLLYLVTFWAEQVSRASFRQAMPPYPYSNSAPAQTNGTTFWLHAFYCADGFILRCCATLLKRSWATFPTPSLFKLPGSHGTIWKHSNKIQKSYKTAGTAVCKEHSAKVTRGLIPGLRPC